MANIYHELPIRAPIAGVFDAISTPDGLNAWWTLRADGMPSVGHSYTLDFGPGYIWHAMVTACAAPDHIEWEFTNADPDWQGTRLRIDLHARNSQTVLSFAHTGWLSTNTHYRVSSFCWAMYLRLLKRYVERNLAVPYCERLDD